jgi:AcrR family transcriptional regulator
VSPSQAERTEATRAALLRAARSLFAERGYAATAAEEVVRRAGVTRGAMYHHFRDKKALFRAVHEQIEEEMVVAIGQRIAGLEDPLEILVAGVDTFLDRCLDPEVAKITLDEAPSVLGWLEWREIDAKYALGLVTGVLRVAMDAGTLKRQPIEPLGHLLISACGEAGLLIAAADDPGAARDEVRGPLLALLDGLRS